MKKITLLATLMIMTLMVFSQTKTIYLNSKTISCNVKGVKKECLQYKTVETDTAWATYSGNIQGFTYNPGYFYTLQVKPVSKTSKDWKLVKTVSKKKSTMQQLPGDSTSAMLSKPPVALVGQWNFTSLSPEAGGASFTKEFLRFDAVEMRVTGKASCNSFFGNYTADTTKGERAIHFEAIGHTMMACENLATENKMLHALELVDNWKIEGNKLYLMTGDKLVVTLTRVTTGTM